MTKQEKITGILGGMGPAATLALYERIIALTPAQCDQEHLRVIIDSNPKIPDRTAAILGKGESPLPVMIESAKTLERAGADFITIPCNSAHSFLDGIRESVNIPVLDMIGETVRTIKESQAGLLATDGALASRLYHDACERERIELLVPSEEDQTLVMSAIYGIKAGEETAAFECNIRRVIAKLQKSGAEAIILGCTELSLILDREGFPVSVYDALGILAQVAVQQALSLSE